MEDREENTRKKTDRQAKRQRQNRKRKTVSELTSLTYRAEERTDQSDSRKAKKRQSKTASKKRVRGGSRDREQSSSSIPLHDTKAACITVLPVTSLQLQPHFHRVWVRNMHICVCTSECVCTPSIFLHFYIPRSRSLTVIQTFLLLQSPLGWFYGACP